MSYVVPDYKTRKQFVTAVETGYRHLTFAPDGIFTPAYGRDVVEGPHFGKRRWRASVIVQGGIVTKVVRRLPSDKYKDHVNRYLNGTLKGQSQ